MCGRYASTKARADLLSEFDVFESYADEEQRVDHNVAPTKQAPVVLTSTPRGQEAAVRQLRNLRWGLVPFWAKDPTIGNKMINARAETVHQKRSYAKPFAQRRLLVPVAGFFEWLPTEQLGKSGKPLKQPFYIHPTDSDRSLALAGIYSWWKVSSKAADDPDRWLGTYSIITTTATDEVGRVHDRMPMTVPQKNWDAWLDPEQTDPDGAHELMAPPESNSLEMYPVSKAVNNVKNNGPELLEPDAIGGISDAD